MYNSIFKYNDLDQSKVTRTELLELVELAKSENQTFIVQKISDLLRENPDVTCFKITLKSKIPTYQIEDGFLGALEEVPQELQNEEDAGLGSPTYGYKEIAKILLDRIKTATGLHVKKKWKDSQMLKENDRALTGFTFPINFVSKKPYNGVNFLMLKTSKSFFEPFNNPYFLTLKQVEEKGGTLKKNAKPTEVIYFNYFPKGITEKVKKEHLKILKQRGFINRGKTLNDLGLTKDDVGWGAFLKSFIVYNGEDVEGINFELDKLKALQVEAERKNNGKKIERAEKLIASYPDPKPKIYDKGTGIRAYYVPDSDVINVPSLLAFDTPQDYYRVLFHELTHSTGNKNRLNRNLSGKFGTEDYAKEELVAEFGAVFLSSYAGINWEQERNHPEYLKNWLNTIKQAEKKPTILLRAVINAKKASDFIAKDYLKELTTIIKPTKNIDTKKPTEKAVATKTKPKPATKIKNIDTKKTTKKAVATPTKPKPATKIKNIDTKKPTFKEIEELWNAL